MDIYYGLNDDARKGFKQRLLHGLIISIIITYFIVILSQRNYIQLPFFIIIFTIFNCLYIICDLCILWGIIYLNTYGNTIYVCDAIFGCICLFPSLLYWLQYNI